MCQVAGQQVVLTGREMDILSLLMRRPDTVAAPPALVDELYGRAVGVSDRTLDSHLRNLRRKLGEQGWSSAIETVHGIGLRMGAWST